MNKEIIETINNIPSLLDGDKVSEEDSVKISVALVKAVQALKQPFEQIEWERDCAIEQLKELGYGLGERVRTSDDAISRQGAIEAFSDMRDGFPKTNGSVYTDISIVSVINDLPPVTPIQPCDDAVSRQAVQEANTISIELKENPHQMWQRIQNLPSVTPKPKTGKWIWSERKFIDVCKCSECGCGSWEMEFNFCPSCGAKMEDSRWKNT